MIIKTPVTTNYFSAPNHIAQDNTLSDRAARIITYAASLPTNWRIIPKQLMKYFGWGRDSTYRALHELCAKGYAVLKRGKQFAEWIIYTSPQIPETTKATSGAACKNPDFKNPYQTDTLQSNKDLQNNEITTTAPVNQVQELAIKAPATPIVVVQDGSIYEKEPHQTHTDHPDSGLKQREVVAGFALNQSNCPNVAGNADGIGIDSIPGIDKRHQKVARQALERLTPEQAQAVVTAFTLQASKTTITNKVGYLISLTKAAIDGSFSPVSGSGAALVQSLDDRLRLERQRQKEAQNRGKMTVEEHAAWLAETFGAKPVDAGKASGRGVGLRSMLGWV